MKLRLIASGLLGLFAAAACGDDTDGGNGGSGGAGGSGGSGGSGAGTPTERLALSFEPVPFETDLSYITDLAFVPGDSGEFFVSDLYGGVELAQMNEDRAEVLFSASVDDVFAEYDAGMLALAVDPDFAENGFFYLALNLAKNHVVVRRYTLDREDPVATIDSAVVILEIEVNSSPRWHNITSMGFEEDGVMWLLVGDKGIALPSDPDPTTTVAQDPSTILGSLIRIVPSKDATEGGYEPVPGATPYSEDADPAIFAKGMRSPWQGIYHEGRWFYGEVGLEDIEEVNVISEVGQNMGWPVVEGPCDLDIHQHDPDCSLYTDPWIFFDRNNSSQYVLDDEDAVPTNKRSVYAGWIYKPNDNDRYQGFWNDVLVWGDAFVGFMRASEVDKDADGWHLGHVQFPSAWDQGPDGYVYMVSLSEEPDAGEPGNVSGLPSPLYRAMLVE